MTARCIRVVVAHVRAPRTPWCAFAFALCEYIVGCAGAAHVFQWRLFRLPFRLELGVRQHLGTRGPCFVGPGILAFIDRMPGLLTPLANALLAEARTLREAHPRWVHRVEKTYSKKSLTKTSCIRDASRCVRARGEQVHKEHRSPPAPPLSHDVFAESLCNRFGGTSGKACRRPSSACAGHRRAPPPPNEPCTLGPHATAYNPPPLPTASGWRRISWNAHEHEPGRTQAW